MSEKTIKVYHKKSGQNIKSSLYISEFGTYGQYEEIHAYMRHNPDCTFDIRPCSKLPPERQEESYYLVPILKSAEGRKGSVEFLNRVIRNGGFINYIKKLNAQMEKTNE